MRWIGVVVAVSACDSGGAALHLLRPRLEATPNPLIFESAVAGLRERRSLAIANRGDDVLHVADVTVSAKARASFSIADAPSWPAAIPIGGSLEIEVELSGALRGRAGGELIITSDDPARPHYVVPLEATPREGAVLRICVDHRGQVSCDEPPLLDFGEIGAGGVATASIRVISGGTAPLAIGSAAPRGAGPRSFTFDPPDARELVIAPGEESIIRVRYAPAAAELVKSRLTITSNDVEHPRADVAIRGAASTPSLCLEPASIDFGIVPRGQRRERFLRARSCGPTAPEIRSMSLEPAPGDFSVAVPAGVYGAGTARVDLQIPVRYEPVDEGRDDATFRVHTSGGDAVASITGRTAGCQLIATPDHLGFNARKLVRTVLLENAGAKSCSVSAVDFATGRSWALHRPIVLPHLLAPGESLRVGVAYRGTFSASDVFDRLLVHSDDVEHPMLAIELRATSGQLEGCALDLAPSVATFGAVSAGTVATRVIEAANVGLGACRLERVELAAGSHATFTVSADADLIAPGDEVRIVVSFHPPAAGAFAGTVHIGADEEDMPITEIPLSGVGVVRGICVEPRELHFENDTGAATKKFTIDACGSAPLTVTALDFTTADPELRFENPPLLPFTLNPGESLAVGLIYAPRDTAGDTAIVAVRSDDPVYPSIEVRATGGAEIVPTSVGRYLYVWQVRDGSSDVVRAPLQGNLQIEEFWGERTGRACSGCHSVSPDGQYMAIVERGPVGVLTIIDTETRVAVETTETIEGGVSWNPKTATIPSHQFVYSDGADLRLGSAIWSGSLGTIPGADDPEKLELTPAWGPDGKIAFARADSSAAPAELMLIEEGGGVPETLRRAGPHTERPVYSPNGRWIAFTRNAGAPGLLRQIGLAAADNSGAGSDLPEANGTEGATSYPAWSLDGTYLSFSSNRPGGRGGWDIYIAPINPQTGMEGRATNLGMINTAGFDHAAIWSH